MRERETEERWGGRNIHNRQRRDGEGEAYITARGRAALHFREWCKFTSSKYTLQPSTVVQNIFYNPALLLKSGANLHCITLHYIALHYIINITPQHWFKSAMQIYITL